MLPGRLLENRWREVVRVELAFRPAFRPFVSEVPSRLHPAADGERRVLLRRTRSVGCLDPAGVL